MADNAPGPEQSLPPSTSVPLKPRATGSNTYTIDISKKFRDAVLCLGAGTLVKDEHFTLFESVGALEIGDPKMDSGCVDDGQSPDQDEDEGFNVCKSPSSAEIIWLMDELLSREVAWHIGYPLSQTLFTSVHIEKLLWPTPIRLDDAQFSKSSERRSADPMLHKLFRSYCLGLIKSCDLVLAMVTSQHYYEEEDFATQLYNRELLDRFSVDEILTDMDESIEYLQGTDLENIMKSSLEARMKFRYSLLSMLSSHVIAPMSSTSVMIFDNALLSHIQKSRIQGTPIHDAFTLKIQRKLASTVPPRPMVTIDEKRTFDYLYQFVRDCQNAFSVLCASHACDLLTGYTVFSAQNPQPSVYVRALLQSWLSRIDSVGGIAHESDFIFNDIQSTTLAASPVAQALHSSSECLTSDLKLVQHHLREFLGKNGRSFLNIWRTACLNRCRVRRTLCHAAVEWDQIQAEAEELDDELQRLTMERAVEFPVGAAPTFSYSLSSWVYHHKLLQLRLILHLGFELEIYAPYELSGMFWYLGHLSDAHLTHLERISFFTSQRKAALRAISQRSALENSQAEDCDACLRYLFRHFSLLKATEAAARALHCLYTVLQRHGQFQQPITTYASDSLRYELRMRPFLYLSIPEPLRFDQYSRLSQMEVRTDLEILEEAASLALVAKKGWEEVLKAKWNAFPLRDDTQEEPANTITGLWATDVRGAIKASIGMSIAIGTLQRQLQAKGTGQKLQITAIIPQQGDKDHWHSWWPVPRLTF